MPRKRSAKGQFVATRVKRTKRAPAEAPAPRKRRRRARRNPSLSLAAAPIANPESLSELAEFILPGFAGYGATKMLARVINLQLSKKYPSMGKHVAVASTVGAFLASWFLLHRIKRLAPYQIPATVGAGIASLQTIVSTYLPKYGWMVSDAIPSPANTPLTTFAPNVTSPGSPSTVETLFPGGPEVVQPTGDDDLDLESIDLGSLGGGGDVEDYMTAAN